MTSVLTSYVKYTTLLGDNGLLSATKSDDIRPDKSDPSEGPRARIIWLDGPTTSGYFAVSGPTFYSLLQPAPDSSSCANYCHEVICADYRQRIRFDVDCDDNSLSEADVTKLTNEIIQHSIHNMFTWYARPIKTDDFCICTSSSSTQKKVSFHIILVPYAAKNSADVKAFCEIVINDLSPEYARYIDTNIYSTSATKNFRMVNNKKPDGRVKTITTGHKPEDAIIAWPPGCINLRRLVQRDPASLELSKSIRMMADIPSADMEQIRALAEKAGILAYNDIYSARDKIVSMTRIYPHHCEFCDREHAKDNTDYLYIVPGTNSANVLHGCTRQKGKYKNIGSFIPSEQMLARLPQPEAAPTTSADSYLSTYCKTIRPTDVSARVTTIKAFIPEADIVKYDEPMMRPLEHVDTLIVCAAMKMGKTKALKDYIKNNFDADAVIRIVSFRQTFSGNMGKVFGDFSMYNKQSGRLTQNRLIVQVESLHRMDISDTVPDLLVLDESESIFEQFTSGLSSDHYGDWAAFKWMLEYSKHVVVMDAGITRRSINMIAEMRRSKIKAAGSRTQFHYNTHKNAVDDEYFVTNSKEHWYYMLQSELDSGNKIAVAVNSLTEGAALRQFVVDKYPDLQVSLYSSETPNSIKFEHFANVHEFWAVDVLIYTPTVTAGVSFELEHFNTMFGYFTSESCTVETCMQMMGRIRNISSRSYYIMLSTSPCDLVCDTADIITYLKCRRSCLMSTQGVKNSVMDRDMPYEYTETGFANYIQNAFFKLWVENIRMQNISRSRFMTHFISTVKSTGASVIYMSPAVMTKLSGDDEEVIKEAINEIRDVIKAKKEKTVADKCREIAESRELTEYEVEAIKDAKICGRNVTLEQMRAYDKYKLRRLYRWGNDIDTDFVKTYNTPLAKAAFVNLRQIFGEGLTYDAAIARIKSREEELFGIALACNGNNNDIIRPYKYDIHDTIRQWLGEIGWDDLASNKAVGLLDMRNALEKIHEDLKGAPAMYFTMFNTRNKINKIKADRAPYEETYKFINAVLRKVYMMKIKLVRDMYYVLRLPPEFDFSSGDTGAHVPRVYMIDVRPKIEDVDILAANDDTAM